MLNWFARRMKEAREDEQGFTLIELLVVVIIIGILAAIAIPTFLAQRDNARVATIESDLRNAAEAATACASSNEGSYATCNTLVALQDSDFNPSDGADWAGATITADADSFTVTGLEHVDNDTIVGTYSTDGADAGQVVVTDPA